MTAEGQEDGRWAARSEWGCQPRPSRRDVTTAIMPPTRLKRVLLSVDQGDVRGVSRRWAGMGVFGRR